MLDEINLARAVDTVMEKLEEVNRYFVEKVAEQIKAIGELNPTSINRIALMTEWGADIREITRRLAEATSLTNQGMLAVYQKALNAAYTDPRFQAALRHTSLTPRDAARINQYAQAVSAQTAQQITNLSNTTAVSQTYRAAVDRAVLAVGSGMTDYQSATRQIVRELGSGGIPVRYQSGYRRRLDTAVRQNIIDGANQIAQHCSDAMGEALGYDAYEITAHAMSAPDHEPIQGRVFRKAEFDKLQAGQSFQDVDGNQYAAIKRPIGEWNCRHFAMSFSTQYSRRKWTDGQLADFAATNQAGCTIGGKHFTIYEASQLMRELETQVRREKDVAVAAKAAGDDILRGQCQMRINALMKKYSGIAAASGLTPRRERTMVQGFRAVRA